MYYVFLIMQSEVRAVKPYGRLGFCESLASMCLQTGLAIEDDRPRTCTTCGRLRYGEVVPSRPSQGGVRGMPNERLRGAIVESGMTFEQVATRLGVSAKTVERWIGEPNRKPYRRFQYATASLLQREVSYLWPEERTSAEVAEAGNAELIKLYPHRSVVPNRLWPQLYAQATQSFDVLVYSGFWLTEDATFHRIVKEKSAVGVSVRFMLGDPDCLAVAVRGEDEGIGLAMAGKIRNALINYSPLFGLPGVEFRLHSTTLYNSLYRADDEMLANGHLYGVGAYMAPVLHLQRVPGGELFDAYAESIERVWESARPISSPADYGGLHA